MEVDSPWSQECNTTHHKTGAHSGQKGRPGNREVEEYMAKAECSWKQLKTQAQDRVCRKGVVRNGICSVSRDGPYDPAPGESCVPLLKDNAFVELCKFG